MYSKALSAEIEALRDSSRGAHVSATAIELHVRTVYRSVRTRRPSFVSDASLDAIAPGSVTTIAALELWTAGLWQRVPGGYLIDDTELIAHLSAGPVRRLARRVWKRLNNGSIIPF
ncbi:hypothetical protein FZI85_22340 [Mycobacterium sp. CBMA293]|uniref:hypothetical protein n=1 Tax=unclassified Mycolicibacterium TaxID=2636767 RepID=UPI00132966A4|nr:MULTISPECIES: hypothetical protein [unclassified Mycolicibacterium]MUL46001.1 hypothetical protein [Mycolicibacterium sp. CBMA 360]MUL95111.1 hypothetical protein [Mycolicibacterium sp. CBMA 230]MUM33489.1 hypothetical protein [Mycolicibacterium sp. CBMA 361]MUL60673.1 hypothetical protein [Mycolicibacterium sp. CBMA 335]MUL72488.1 hypothetical protein [Mycolicibacterium sp. CBMA 311]